MQFVHGAPQRERNCVEQRWADIPSKTALNARPELPCISVMAASLRHSLAGVRSRVALCRHNACFAFAARTYYVLPLRKSQSTPPMHLPKRCMGTNEGRSKGSGANGGSGATEVVSSTKSDEGGVALSSPAWAGLSPETRTEWAARLRKGEELPVIWENPGAYGQLSRVSPEIIGALPPPPRPLWPMKDSELTWRYLRAFAVALAFGSLATYLALKQRIHGTARLDLEASAPTVARALERLNVIQDFRPMEASLHRPDLFGRLFRRYATGGNGTAPTIPTPRGVFLLSSLWPTHPVVVEARDSSSATATGPTSVVVVQDAAFMSALADHISAAPHQWSESQFVAAAEAATAGITTTILYLVCLQRLGIVALLPETATLLDDFYGRVISARSSGASFTPQALTELCCDIGFTVDLETTAAFLNNCTAAVHANAATNRITTPLVASSSAAVAVAVSKQEFVDFLALCAGSAQVDESRIPDYLKVFILLHLSGMREHAGVPAIA